MKRGLVVGLLLGGALLAARRAPHVEIEGDRRVVKSASGYQSVSMLDGGRTGTYRDLGELAGELRPGARQVLLLGLGGGEMLRAARRTLPHALLVGVDVDAAAVAAAYTDFRIGDFGAFGVQADGVSYLEGRPDASVDVLMVDVFDDDRIPDRFASGPFFELARRKLSRQGLLMMNVYPAERLLEVLAAMQAVGFKARLRFSGSEALVIAEP